MGYPITSKTIHDLRDKPIASPIKGGLLIHTNRAGINYKLVNVSSEIMIKIIEKSGIISNIWQFQ